MRAMVSSEVTTQLRITTERKTYAAELKRLEHSDLHHVDQSLLAA
jgi:hypothetical protein